VAEPPDHEVQQHPEIGVRLDDEDARHPAEPSRRSRGIRSRAGMKTV
jgi:hypothetical protein